MSATTGLAPVIYPESDGKPMADNTIQFRWILTLAMNLLMLFRNRNDVLVGGNIFWYPVEGFPNIVQAPDVYVVFDRPLGDRASYKQWEENNIPMSVVFEIRSPNDSDALMRSKREFYDEHGVSEYYMYDPQMNTLEVYLRRGGDLGPQRLVSGSFTSPHLSIRFQASEPELLVFHPDGTPFRSPAETRESELAALSLATLEQDLREAAERERELARQEAETAHRERELARQEAEAAHRERELARQEAEAASRERELARQEKQAAEARATQAEQRTNRLRELSRKALRGQADSAELAELEALLGTTPE